MGLSFIRDLKASKKKSNNKDFGKKVFWTIRLAIKGFVTKRNKY